MMVIIKCREICKLSLPSIKTTHFGMANRTLYKTRYCSNHTESWRMPQRSTERPPTDRTPFHRDFGTPHVHRTTPATAIYAWSSDRYFGACLHPLSAFTTENSGTSARKYSCGEPWTNCCRQFGKLSPNTSGNGAAAQSTCHPAIFNHRQHS